jgi:hypothetical protein
MLPDLMRAMAITFLSVELIGPDIRASQRQLPTAPARVGLTGTIRDLVVGLGRPPGSTPRHGCHPTLSQ